MNPLFFGSSDRALFGMFHPATGRVRRDSGIVLCYPMGQEYMRSHRAIKQLALMLSKSGFDVLRFDYSCTGDSYGNCEESSLLKWIEDISTAVDELRDTAGVEKVSLVGLRVGAALAALASTRISNLQSVLLWDPVVSGDKYISEMLNAERELSDQSGFGAKRRNESFESQLTKGQTIGVMGYPLTESLRKELLEIELTSVDQINAEEVALVVSSHRGEFDKLKEHLDNISNRLFFQVTPSPGDWCEVDNFGGVLLPQQMLRGISAYFG